MNELHWECLRENKCPSCRRSLSSSIVNPRQPGHLSCRCGFDIPQERYNVIIGGLATELPEPAVLEEPDPEAAEIALQIATQGSAYEV